MPIRYRYEEVRRAKDCDAPIQLHERVGNVLFKTLPYGRHTFSCGCVIQTRKPRVSFWTDLRVALFGPTRPLKIVK